MHRLFYLKYFLVVSTLLIFHELKAEQTGKVLIDSDFKVTKFLNADVNGSYNIMRKVVGETIYDMVNSIEVCSMPYKFSVSF